MTIPAIEGFEPKLNEVLTFRRKGEPDLHCRVISISTNGEFDVEPMSIARAEAEIAFTKRLGDLCFARIQEGRRAKNR